MEDTQIWYNQNCSKCRNALNFLEDNTMVPQVRNYLENPPSKDELKDILKKLNMNARELLRTKEELYTTLNLKDENSEEKLIEIMVKNPILIERPIIIKGDIAVVGRSNEKLEELIK